MKTEDYICKEPIIMVDIDKVKPYPNNPRINDAAAKELANSIRIYGFNQPIQVNKDYVILAGHTRLKAAKILEMKEVPVQVIKHLSPVEENAYRIADNKLSSLSIFNEFMLAEEIRKLLEDDFSMEGLGFTQEELDRLENMDLPDELELEKESSDVKDVKPNLLRFGKYQIIITKEEEDNLKACYDDFCVENQNGFGFIEWLLKGK